MFRPEGHDVVADCRLTGHRALPNQAEPQITTHFTARVRLTRQAREAAPAPAPDAPAESVVEAADIYRVYFHGPAYQVLERAWRRGRQIIGQMAMTLPSDHVPSDRPTVLAPRLVELCFQTAALGEIAEQGRMGLPQHVSEVSMWRTPDFAAGPLYAVTTPGADEGSVEADVVDTTGNRYMHLRGYRMVAYPDGIDEEPLKAVQAVMVG
jgi:hypothetical protein